MLLIKRLLLSLKSKTPRSCFSTSVTLTERRQLKILFFGTDSFSLPTLQLLHEDLNSKTSGSSKVVTRLEACCSEMKRLVPVVRKFSLDSDIPLHPWPPDPSFCKTFDIGIVSSFGHLIPSSIINAFPLGMLNVHASLLPKWRGASPIIHAILNGESSTGISIMEIAPKHFDIGHVLATTNVEIHPDSTNFEVSKIMGEKGARLMLDVLADLDSYRKSSQPQSTEGVSYAPMMKKKHRQIQWTENTAYEVYNQYRALSDLSKLFSFWEETGVKVRFQDIVHPEVINSVNLGQRAPNAKPGQVFSIKQKGQERLLCVKCKEGWVAFRSFYYGPKKVMKASDFYAGYVSKHKDRDLFFVTKENP